MFLSDRLNLSSEREYTDEGFLRVPARISRIGIQNYYAGEMNLTDRDPADIIRVYRPEEEVFSDESLGSFSNKPVTNNHPPELVSPDNAKLFSVGMSGPEIVRDGMFAKTVLNVTDGEAIKNIESGKTELSNGYTADIEWTSGVTPEGETYDAIQRNIRGNHIAIVDKGRAGPACRVADNLTTLGDEVIMAKITVDGVDFEVTEQAAQAVGKLQSRVRDAEEETEKKKDELKAKEDELEEKDEESKKDSEEAKAKLDDALSKVPSAETLDKLVADRQAVIDGILKVAPEVKWEGKDADTLRKEVVGLKCPTVQLDSVSPDYINARFDMLLDSVESNPQQSLDNAFTQHVKKVDDKDVDNRPASVIARDNMMTASRNAWKPAGANP